MANSHSLLILKGLSFSLLIRLAGLSLKSMSFSRRLGEKFIQASIILTLRNGLSGVASLKSNLKMSLLGYIMCIFCRDSGTELNKFYA